MPLVSIPSRLSALALLALSMCAAGCSSALASGSGSPQEAVSGLLAPFAKPHRDGGRNEQRRANQVQALWRSLCEQVDPKIRPGLHFYEKAKIDPLVNCGAVVSLMVAYTGDTGPVAAPETIRATPLSAATRGDTSVVKVTLLHRRSRGRLPGSAVSGDGEGPDGPSRRPVVRGHTGRRQPGACAHRRVHRSAVARRPRQVARGRQVATAG